MDCTTFVKVHTGRTRVTVLTRLNSTETSLNAVELVVLAVLNSPSVEGFIGFASKRRGVQHTYGGCELSDARVSRTDRCNEIPVENADGLIDFESSARVAKRKTNPNAHAPNVATMLNGRPGNRRKNSDSSFITVRTSWCAARLTDNTIIYDHRKDNDPWVSRTVVRVITDRNHTT